MPGIGQGCGRAPAGAVKGVLTVNLGTGTLITGHTPCGDLGHDAVARPAGRKVFGADIGVELVLRVPAAGARIAAVAAPATKHRHTDRAARPGQAGKGGGDRCGIGIAGRRPTGHAAKLDAAKHRLHLDHPPVGAKALVQPAKTRRMRARVNRIPAFAMVLAGPHPAPQVAVIGGDHAALAAGGHDLVLTERPRANMADRADHPPLVTRTMGLGASLITFSPWQAASAMIGSMSQGQPARCTTTTARVRGVSTAAMVSAVRLPLSRSPSANTGVDPALTTHDTDINVIRDHDVAVAFRPGCEGHEIADHAVMRNMGIDVGMKAATDADVRYKGDKRRQHRTFADLDCVHDHDISGAHLEQANPGIGTLLCQFFVHRRIGNGKANLTHRAAGIPSTAGVGRPGSSRRSGHSSVPAPYHGWWRAGTAPTGSAARHRATRGPAHQGHRAWCGISLSGTACRPVRAEAGKATPMPPSGGGSAAPPFRTIPAIIARSENGGLPQSFEHHLARDRKINTQAVARLINQVRRHHAVGQGPSHALRALAVASYL